MADCLDDVCRDGYQGSVVENVIDILSPLTNEGKYIIHIFNKRWTKLWRLFFDEVSELDEKSQQQFLNYKFKDPSEMKFSGYVMTNSDCAFEWREEVLCTPKTTVATNALINATTLIVTDVTKLMGIGDGSEIYIIKANGKIAKARVASVNTGTDTLTLDAPGLSLAVTAGDTVYRGAWNRSWSCAAAIANEYTYRGARKYTSNFRKINGSLDFASCDLSVDRYVGDAASFVKVKEKALYEGMVNEMLTAFFLDTNVEDTGAGSETMGLLPAIQKAQDDGDFDLIYNYAGCAPAVNATVAEQEEATQGMIGAWFDAILRAYDSGMYEDGKVTVVVNHEQVKAIIKLVPAIRDYVGVTLYQEANSNDISGLDIPVLTYGGLKIEFLYEKFLDIYRFPFHIILPRSGVGVFQRNFPMLTSNGKAIQAIKNLNAKIGAGYPVFRVVDRTDFDTNGMGDCFKFKYEAEFAVVWAGMDKGAYLVGLNLAPFTTNCDICAAATVDLF